jgi:peptide/nickel transport system substrate-binding protein
MGFISETQKSLTQKRRNKMKHRSKTLRQIGLFSVILSIWMFSPLITFAANKLPDPIIVAFTEDATNLDPPRMSTSTTSRILSHMFDKLVFLNPDLEIVPWLAKSWEQRDDKTLVLHLRNDVTFHNGEKFDAEDVKFSLERFIDPKLSGKTRSKTLLKIGNFKSVEIIDDYTVAIKTKKPAPDLIAVLTRYEMMPKGYYSNTDLNTLITKPVGSGPYKIKSWVRDEKVVLEAFDNYWLGKPLVNQIIFKPIPEVGTRVSALLTGSAHLISNLTPDLIKRVTSDTTRVSARAGQRIMFIGIVTNNPKSPVYDKRVRQAMNYAVDVKAITDTLFHGMTKPYDGFIVEPNNDPSVKAYPYNPEKAKALLKEAGYPNGFEIRFGTTTGSYIKDLEVSQVIAQYLGQVGIKVDLESYDEARFSKAIKSKKGDFELYFLGQGGWASVLQALGRTLDGRQSPWAFHQWVNKDWVELYDKASSEPDRSKYIEHVWKAQKITWDEAPWIFLYHQPAIAGVSKSLGDWEIWANEKMLLHYTVLEKLRK